MGMTTSEFFDTIKKGGKAALDKAGELTEIAKANIDLLSEKSKLEDLYKELGRTTYEVSKGDVNEFDTEDKIEKISIQLAKIEALEEKINELKNVTKCPTCGKINDEHASYCVKCGAKL